MGSRLGQRASKDACLVVPPLFRADSGTNLIKQGENVKGRPCGSVAQLAECSHGKREALGSSPGRATIFSSPVTFIFFNIVFSVETDVSADRSHQDKTSPTMITWRCIFSLGQ